MYSMESKTLRESSPLHFGLVLNRVYGHSKCWIKVYISKRLFFKVLWSSKSMPWTWNWKDRAEESAFSQLRRIHTRNVPNRQSSDCYSASPDAPADVAKVIHKWPRTVLRAWGHTDCQYWQLPENLSHSWEGFMCRLQRQKKYGFLWLFFCNLWIIFINYLKLIRVSKN